MFWEVAEDCMKEGRSSEERWLHALSQARQLAHSFHHQYSEQSLAGCSAQASQGCN